MQPSVLFGFGRKKDAAKPRRSIPNPNEIDALSLADFTAESLIVPQVSKSSTDAVIRSLTQLLCDAGKFNDSSLFYNAVISRESLVSTAMGYGIAFPHARLDGFARVVFALGRSAAPIPWGPLSTSPVHLIFLVGVPASDAAGYLSLISRFARLGKDQELLSKLQNAPDAGQMFSVLKAIKLRHPF